METAAGFWCKNEQAEDGAYGRFEGHLGRERCCGHSSQG
jgi:hypothetical protein